MRSTKRFLPCLLAAAMVMTSISPAAVMADPNPTVAESSVENSDIGGDNTESSLNISEDTSDGAGDSTSTDAAGGSSAADAAGSASGNNSQSNANNNSTDISDTGTDSGSTNQSSETIETEIITQENNTASAGTDTQVSAAASDTEIIKDGVITVDNTNVTWEQAVEAANAATEAVTIKLAADVSSANAETKLGNASADITLDLNGKTLAVKQPDSETQGKLTANAGKIVINGNDGKVIGGEYCISVSGADVIINDGEYYAGGYASLCLTGGTLTINEGTYTGKNNGLLMMGGEANLNGGTFRSEGFNEMFMFMPVLIGAGTVNYPEGYVLTGNTANDKADDYYIAAVEKDKVTGAIILTYSLDGKNVSQGFDTIASFNEGMKSLNEQATDVTIQLQNDISFEANSVEETMNIPCDCTLDLNGKKLFATSEESQGFRAQMIRVEKGTLTVDDTSAEKEGLISLSAPKAFGPSVIGAVQGAMIIVNNGTVESDNSAPFALYCEPSNSAVEAVTEITINGGTIKGKIGGLGIKKVTSHGGLIQITNTASYGFSGQKGSIKKVVMDGGEINSLMSAFRLGPGIEAIITGGKIYSHNGNAVDAQNCTVVIGGDAVLESEEYAAVSCNGGGTIVTVEDNAKLIGGTNAIEYDDESAIKFNGSHKVTKNSGYFKYGEGKLPFMRGTEDIIYPEGKILSSEPVSSGEYAGFYTLTDEEQVDFSELNRLISLSDEKINEGQPEDISPKKWTAFTDAYDTAKTIRNFKVNQYETDLYTTDLEETLKAVGVNTDKPSEESYQFGTDWKVLTPGTYTVPIALKQAAHKDQKSMANGTIPDTATLTVAQDGSAVLTITPLKDINIQGITEMAYAWKVYQDNSVMGSTVAMTVDETTSFTGSVGGTKTVPTKVHFTIPSAMTKEDGVYVTMYVDAMGSAPDAWLEIDYAGIDTAQPSASYQFGTDWTELSEGTYTVPVALKNAANHSNYSAAKASIPATGTLKVANDGTAALTINPLGEVEVFGIKDKAYDWKVYQSTDLNGETADMTVEEAVSYTGTDGVEKTVPKKVTFTIPAAMTKEDGVYVTMYVDAMGSAPDAWLEIDYAGAVSDGKAVSYKGTAHIDQFGEYDVEARVSVGTDGKITDVEITGKNFGGTWEDMNKNKLEKAVNGMKDKYKGLNSKDESSIYDVDTVSGATYSSNAIRDAVMDALQLNHEVKLADPPESLNPGTYTVDIAYYSDAVKHSLLENETRTATLNVTEDGKITLDTDIINGTVKEPLYAEEFAGYYADNDRSKGLKTDAVVTKSDIDYSDTFFEKGTQVVTHVSVPLEGPLAIIYNTNFRLYVPAMNNLNSELRGIQFEHGHFNVDCFIEVRWDTLSQKGGEAEIRPEIAALEDGTYTIQAEMINANKKAKSMSDGAINHEVKLTVFTNAEGKKEYKATVEFKGMTILKQQGYLKELSYYEEGYTNPAVGVIQGSYQPATVLSEYDVKDEFNDGTYGEVYNYPRILEFPLVSTALNDPDGYVALHVFVPVMDAITAGSGDQDVWMKIDWTTLKKGGASFDMDDKKSDVNAGTGTKTSGSGTGKADTAKTGTVIQVGKTYTVDGQDYQVTKAASGTTAGTVTFTKAKNAKKITVPDTVKLADGKTYKVTAVGAKAFTAKKIRTVTVGANVSKLAKKAFAKSRAKKLILKTKRLKKASVKGSLKSSKVKKIQVKVGTKKVNKKFVKKYKKIFTKKNAGKKATVK